MTEPAFAHLLAGVASAPGSVANVLTDGVSRCTYRDVPRILAHIDRWLDQRNVSPDNCIAVVCPHSLLGAMTVLSMFDKGRDFVLVPALEPSGSAADAAIPRFCRYRLTVAEPPAGDAWMESSGSYLSIDINPRFSHPASGESGRASPRFYVRTSGSLGQSKLVVHEHSRFVGNARVCVERFRLTAGDRIAIPVPIAHMYGLGAAFIPGVLAGASVDVQIASNLLRYMDRERSFDPNVAFLTPAMCSMLIRGRRGSRKHRLVVTAGDRIREEVFREFDDRFGPLLNLYGSSEMGAAATCDIGDALDLRATTIGKPMSGVTLRLDTGTDDDAQGELTCRNTYGFMGYMDSDGVALAGAPEWYRTGDLARRNPDGALQILGRIDNAINRSGRLVMFEDIEKAMEGMPGVQRAVVVNAPGECEHGQRIAAFCIAGGGGQLSGSEVRQSCFEVLPRFAVPDIVFIIDSLPTLASGKLDRQSLSAMASARLES